MKRYTGNMNGERYCANTNTKEVHDLDNEKTSCNIDAIIRAGNDKPYTSLVQAHLDGYDNCAYCLGSSRR